MVNEHSEGAELSSPQIPVFLDEYHLAFSFYQTVSN